MHPTPHVALPAQSSPPMLTAASQLAARYAHLALLAHEVLVVVGLDPDGQLRCEHTFVGDAGSVDVRPRDVLRPVVAAGAAALALVHNHPSGTNKPSAADLAFTTRVADAARLLGLALVDHVIVASGGWTSLAQRGWLTAPGGWP